MKTERAYPAVVIHARGTKKAQGGHPWVFDNEITEMRGPPEDGATAICAAGPVEFAVTVQDHLAAAFARLPVRQAAEELERQEQRPARQMEMG